MYALNVQKLMKAFAATVYMPIAGWYVINTYPCAATVSNQRHMFATPVPKDATVIKIATYMVRGMRMTFPRKGILKNDKDCE